MFYYKHRAGRQKRDFREWCIEAGVIKNPSIKPIVTKIAKALEKSLDELAEN